MKIFGFNLHNENKFINITCNLILCCLVLFIFGLSILSPLSTDAYVVSSPAIYCGDKDDNKVCLMVNVYWGTEYLDKMLDVLEQNDVKTTFFIGGYWAGKNNEMLKKIYQKGHEIANHGYFHKDHSKLNYEQNQKEITMTQELIESIIGVKTVLFAPPSGSFNDRVLSVADSLGYKTIMWSRDTIDWRDRDENLIFKRATEKTSGGDLILMHPTLQTANALDKIIKTLKNKGLEVTTVSRTLGEK